MSIVEKSIKRLKDRVEPEAHGAASLALLGASLGGNASIKLEPAVPRNDLEPLDFNDSAALSAGVDLAASRGGQLLSQMRALKRKALDMVRARRAAGEAPLIITTSAVPGDGKSFITFHLAMSLTTERDLDVTLIDGDIARQRASSFFAGSEDGGLSSCLHGDSPLATVIRNTTVPSLSVVRAGATTPTSSEALTSSRWDALAAEMRASGPSRVFLVDTAPVLATAEAQYLARTADLILFVVRSEVTPQQAVTEAIARIGDMSRVAFVFNGYRSVGTDFYYDYSNYGAQGDAIKPHKKG